MSDVIPIGKLDRHLMLQSPVRTGDAAGGATIAWSLVAEVWAAVRPSSGAESLDGEALRGRISHEVVIRHGDGVTPDMRFLMGTRALEIRAVQEMGGRRRYLRCLCEEKVT